MSTAPSPSIAGHSIFDELSWRGLVYAASEGAKEHLEKEKATLYIGFDPTAASLHVGSLLQILALARMQRFGHVPIGLVGGGTGMIGDPSGKTVERQLLTREKVQENLAGIREQLSRFLDFDAKANAAQVVDNGEWLNSVGLIDFLRDIGKHFTINYLVAKESVKRRMESDDGLSYTEFSYSLLQAYDFLVLHDRYGCTLQMGASDQWGNITAGFELIRKLRQRRSYGLVSPLVVSASGVKFGKTEAGTIWLDANLTSPYRFYQFWLNTTDDDAPTYLKYFTWLGRPEIEELIGRHGEAPSDRLAQRTLAQEVTRMVHGETALSQAERSSQVLFGGEVADLKAAEALDIFAEVPSSTLEPSRLDAGMPLGDLLTEAGLVTSKSEARRKIREGGIYLNNRRVVDEKAQVSRQDFLDGQVLVLRKGRKDYHLVRLQGA